MDDSCDVEAVLLPPAGAGQVLLVGAATLVSYAIDDLELGAEFFVEQAGPDGAGVRCVGVQRPDDVEAVRRRVGSVLEGLVGTTPELAGWGVRVDVLADSSDEIEGLDDSDDDGLDDSDDVLDGAGEVELDVDALLPSGDELLGELVHAIEHEQAVYADAASFRAVPIEDLVPEDLDDLDDGERKAALQRGSALAGCLIQGSVWVVDRLFDDVAEVGGPDEAGSFEVADTWILSELPPRFAGRYSARFAKEFLVATVDLSGRLTGGWQPMSCVAQELGMRLVLNAVEMVADSADVRLPEDWRPHLEELFFEDLDHEYLYDPAFDGIEDHPESGPPGMAPMGFDDWFTPFNEQRTLPPYAL